MRLFSFIFGKKTNQIQDYLDKDAIILDVRTLSEYNADHIKDVIHIPISELKTHIEELKKLNKPVIAHCKSGIRSAQAKQILNVNGIDAINGGGISALKKALQ